MTTKDSTSSLVSVPLENYRIYTFECSCAIGALQHCGLQQPEFIHCNQIEVFVTIS